MAKKKGRRASAADVQPPAMPDGSAATPAGVRQPPLPPPSADVLHSLGAPVLAAQLSGGSGDGLPGRIYLPPDTMHAERISAGELLAVGAAQSGSTALAAPATTQPQPLFGTPPPAQRPDAAGFMLCSICSTLAEAHKLSINATEAVLPGDFVALAEAWPRPQLPRDATALSPDVSRSLGALPVGGHVLIYRAEGLAAAAGQGTTLRLCLDEATGLPAALPRHRPQPPPGGRQPHTAASPARTPPPPPRTLAAAHATPPRLQGGAARSETVPATPPPAGSGPAGVLTSGGGGPGRPDPASAQAPQAGATAAGGSQSGVSANPQASAAAAGGPLAAASADVPEAGWPLRVLSGGGPRQRRLLAALAARQLAGSRPLAGNAAVLPLLGRDIVFRVEAGSGAQLPPGASIQLLGPGEEAAAEQDAGESLMVSAEQAAGRTAPTADAAAAASLAAAAAVGGGETGAAALAAGRAAAASAAALASAGFGSLGGTEAYARVLHDTVTLPLQSPELFVRYGIRPPRGLLLHGPPGCGKTALAKAAAAAAGASLFVLNGSDVVSEVAGDSEAGLKGVFAAARAAAAPAIIFLDEADAVAPARPHSAASGAGGGRSGGPAADAAARLVATLLSEMDGGSAGAEADRVIVIAATNRVDALDPALRRPGRFDRELEVGVPTPAQREAILRAHLRGVKHELSDAGVAALAASAHAFVAADLAALVAEAAMTALRRVVALRQGDNNSRSDSSSGVGQDCNSTPQLESAGQPAGSSADAAAAVDAVGDAAQQLRGLSLGDTTTVFDSPTTVPQPAATVGSSLGAPASSNNAAALAVAAGDMAAKLSDNPQVRGGSDGAAVLAVTAGDMAAELSGSSQVRGGGEGAAALAVTAGDMAAELSGSPQVRGGSDGAAALAVTAGDMAAARGRVRPSGLREVALELPATRWSDIGGLAHVKQQLQEAVEWPQKHPEALERLGAKPPGGVLLFGPPGCSKTLLGRAVAGEAGANFLAVKGPELFSKYVGESEKAVAALFARARRAAPAIVFFDEIDGLAPPRGESGGGVEARVMAQLLTEMDGLTARKGVTVLAATNRPDRVDAALLRPGRFDRLLHVPPPDAEARTAILAVHTRRTPLAADVSLQTLAARAERFTGADCAALVREAGLAALQEDLSSTHVAARHFYAAFQLVQPSAPPSMTMEAIYARFHRPGGSIAAPLAAVLPPKDAAGQ